MAKRKYYFYVGVILSDCQFRFVTSVNNGDHTCSWDKTEKPYLFYDYRDASQVALGLTCNGQVAYPIQVPYEITYPLFKKTEG